MPEPLIFPRDKHTVSRSNIDQDCLKVIHRLQSKGHQAYLVGGAVRDLLLELKPKDFDVSTSAHPREIKKLFRNCWLIGRRFRLAHIKFDGGQKIIETSTFRCAVSAEERGEEEMPITSDNTYGNESEDAFRRDFTINALFYNPSDFSLIDYTGGVADIEDRMIRIIGDPDQRFTEDPVRMLRAVKFSSRLNFEIDKITSQAMHKHHGKIALAAPARILIELWRLLFCSNSVQAFKQLHAFQLLPYLLTEQSMPEELEDWWKLLAAFDALKLEEGHEHYGLALSVLIGQQGLQAIAQRPAGHSISQAILAFLDPLARKYSAPRRVVDEACRILGTVFTLLPENQSKRLRRHTLVKRAVFPDVLQFLKLYTQVKPLPEGTIEDWEKLDREVVRTPKSQLKSIKKSRRRRRPRGPAKK